MDNPPRGFVAGFLRFVLKVFLALIAMVFAACLLAVGLLAVVSTLSKALVTWQKPAPWVVFRRVQKYSACAQWPIKASEGVQPPRNRKNVQDLNVVDVEVRESHQSEPKR